MIIEQLEVGGFAVFAYLLGCQETGEAVVIDPAAEVNRILKVAKSNGVGIIKYIINTHSHADHTGGNRELKEATGAQIVIHRDDAERLLRDPEVDLVALGNVDDVEHTCGPHRLPNRFSVHVEARLWECSQNCRDIRVPDLDEMRKRIYSVSISDRETKKTIKRIYEQHRVLLEPHGAVGWAGLERFLADWEKLKKK